jgi:hypothetical protein
MGIRRASYVSLITAASLLAMLWTVPAVWCVERDGSIQFKTSARCAQSSPHCAGEDEVAKGTDCIDISIYADGLTRDPHRPASINEVSSYAVAVSSATDRSFLCGTAIKTAYLAYEDRSTSPAGPDLTIVLVI